jgi:putative secretion ATPase (PEP-CTERM system associated)
VYSSFYKLTGIPFQLTPDPRFYYGSRTHSKAMAYLTYGLSLGEGFIVITGDIGAGKTTVVGNLLGTLDRNRYHIAKIVAVQNAPDSILRPVAAALSVPQQGRGADELPDGMDMFLRKAHASGRRLLVVVDEAQNLTDAALEELRLLSNYHVAGAALVQTVLVGQPEFRRRLAREAALEPVRQRIVAAYHLLPMGDWNESRAYIQHRLRLVGWDEDPVFTDGAIQAIHEFCDGVPRRLNQVCSRLLLLGYLEELHRIEADTVRTVVAEFVNERSAGDQLDAEPEPVRTAARPSPVPEAPPVQPVRPAPRPSGGAGVREARLQMLIYGFLRQMKQVDPGLLGIVSAALAGEAPAPRPASADPIEALHAEMLMNGFLKAIEGRDPQQIARIVAEVLRAPD